MEEIKSRSVGMTGGQLQKAQIEIQKQSLENRKSNVTNAAEKRLQGLPAQQETTGQSYHFTVQFNPSELQLSGRGGNQAKKTDVQKKSNGNYGAPVVCETVKPQMALSLKLVFDQTDKQEQGVASQNEGFLAAVRNPASRNITFDWNKFHFSGTLESVSAQYTMFSPHGIPLRASVNLEITSK